MGAPKQLHSDAVCKVLVHLTSGVQSFEVTEEEFTIGRSPKNQVVLNDTGVSRVHVRVRWNHLGKVEIQDQNTANGTYLNNARIVPETFIDVSDTAKLRLGRVVVELRVVVATPKQKDLNLHPPALSVVQSSQESLVQPRDTPPQHENSAPFHTDDQEFLRSFRTAEVLLAAARARSNEVLSEMSSQRNQLQQECDQLRFAVQKHQEEKVVLDTKQVALSTEIKQLNLRRDELSQESAQLMEKIEDASRLYADLVTKKDHAQNRFRAIEAQVEECERLISKKENLEKAIDQNTVELASLEKRRETLGVELKDLEQRIVNCHTRAAEAEDTAKKSNTLMEEAVRSFERVHTGQVEAASKQKMLMDLEKSQHELLVLEKKKVVSQLETEIVQIQSNLEEWHQKKRKLQDSVEKLEHTLEEADSKNQLLVERGIKLNKENADLIGVAERLRVDIKDLQAAAVQLEQQRDAVREELARLESSRDQRRATELLELENLKASLLREMQEERARVLEKARVEAKLVIDEAQREKQSIQDAIAEEKKRFEALSRDRMEKLEVEAAAYRLELKKRSETERDSKIREWCDALVTSLAESVVERGGSEIDGKTRASIHKALLVRVERDLKISVEESANRETLRARARKFWLQATFGGAGALVLIALFAWGGVAGKVQDFVSATLIGAKSQQAQHLEEKFEKKRQEAIFEPQRDLRYRGSWTENVLYLEGYREVRSGPSFEREWILMLTPVFLNEFRLSEQALVAFVSAEMVMTRELIEEMTKIHGQHVEEGVAQMRSLEDGRVQRLLELVGSQERLNKIRQMEQALVARLWAQQAP